MSTITSVRVIGSRDDQEDRYCMCPIRMNDIEGHLLAVFDGHNGEETAQYCREHLPTYFQPRNAVDVPDALMRAIQRLSKETGKNESGTTLSAVCMLESIDIAVAAVLGDSPIVIRKQDGTVWTSTLHNVGTNEDERRDAQARGAVYLQGAIHLPHKKGQLEISRALGDASLRDILSDIPEISVIESPAAILIATDGILNDMYTDQETLVELGKEIDKGVDANAILNWRMPLDKFYDNITIVLWKR